MPRGPQIPAQLAAPLHARAPLSFPPRGSGTPPTFSICTLILCRYLGVSPKSPLPFTGVGLGGYHISDKLG